MKRKRIYKSGAQKKKEREQREKLQNSMTGSIDKFLKPLPSTLETSSTATLDSNMIDEFNIENAYIINDDENEKEEVNGNEPKESHDASEEETNNKIDEKEEADSEKNKKEIENEPDIRKNGNEKEDNNEIRFDDHVSFNENVNDLFDPGNWENGISQKLRDLLVEKGPQRVKNLVYPKTLVSKKLRSFNDKHYYRTLSSGGKDDRSWLIYSKKKDKVFCFCCVLFNKGVSSFLTDVTLGLNDWKNIHSRLRTHETSIDHIESLTDWMEAENRFKKKSSIDCSNQRVINKEKEFCREVLKRILCLVKTLASTNIAFRGDNEKIDDANNGNFLSFIKMIAEFDPIMGEHLKRIRKKINKRVHYLSHDIQNEMILLLAGEVKRKVIEIVKGAQFFSVILDCTPDISHQEQMSLILRCVDVSSSPIKIEEFFVGFLKVVQTTGEALFCELKDALEILKLDLNDVRGQGYDNGSNMKGKYKGVSSRVLSEYPRAFYTPCGCHSLNLSLCDMAMSVNEAKTFFGAIQRIYKLFSSSTQRWDVLLTYIKGRYSKGLTLKSWSDTRWESRFSAVKAVRFQTSKIRDALLDIWENGDSTAAGDAKALVKLDFESFDFIVGMVIWYEILQKVNKVSKLLQSKDMDIDVAINLLKGLILFFEEYRENGLDIAKNEADKIASEMGIEPKFIEVRVRKKKKFFDENVSDEPIVLSGEDSFRVNIFLPIIDSALSSLQTRFDQFQKYEETFGFLFNLSKLRNSSVEDLKNSCDALEVFLKKSDSSDVDADELFSELQVLRKSLPKEIARSIEVLEFLKDIRMGYPNAWVAYRIILTIPITVATAERSFSKLKLIKTYLRSTMSQSRLNGLAMLSIEKKMVSQLDCSNLVTEFANRKARRI